MEAFLRRVLFWRNRPETNTTNNLIGRTRLWLADLPHSLSGRLLVLTILVVMIVEVIVFLPSVARHRKDWLMERIGAAQIATIALEIAGDQAIIPDPLRREILMRAEVEGVSVKRDNTRQLVLRPDMTSPIDVQYDLRTETAMDMVGAALSCLLSSENRLLRVVAEGRYGGDDTIEIILHEAPLQKELRGFAVRIFWLSLLISVVTGAAVFLVLSALMVRPIKKITDNMVAFRANPEDASRVIKPSETRHEIGVAERELAEMQYKVREALNQKTRLAALGTAVSKINHDLRNILSSSQLVVDRLAGLSDPTVQKLAPRLLKTIDRAVHLTTETLKYGKSEEAAPVLQKVCLTTVVEEVQTTTPSTPDKPISWTTEVANDLIVRADPDQLFRILMNLCRNSVQILEAQEKERQLNITARREGDMVRIDICDNGPGVPQRAQDSLFQAFSGSVRPGGTGLGLAIARELARAQGGDVTLFKTGDQGTIFRVDIPAAQ